VEFTDTRFLYATRPIHIDLVQGILYEHLMSNKNALLELTCETRLAVRAFGKLGDHGQRVVRAMMASKTTNMVADKENKDLFFPADANFRRKRGGSEDLQGIDFRVMLGLAVAGFGDVIREAEEDGGRIVQFYTDDHLRSIIEAGIDFMFLPGERVKDAASDEEKPKRKRKS
jgi:hypothetical protein